MSHRHVNKRTGLAAGACAIAIAGAAILLPSAHASSEHEQRGDKRTESRVLTPDAAARLGSALTATLGNGAAGWYYSADAKQLVVNVLDARGARSVEAGGGVARIVPNSTAALKGAAQTLKATASVPGTAWSVDPKTNTVSVLADSTVTGDRLATLNRAVDDLGGLVTMKRSAGEFRPFDGHHRGGQDMAGQGSDAQGTGGQDQSGQGTGGQDQSGQDQGGQAVAGVGGGDAIFGGAVRCSLGFNVDVAGAPAFLTAGHCGNEADTWFADQNGTEPLGTVAVSTFPVADFALVTYDDAATQPPSAVDLGDAGTREITRAVDASVGLQVTRSGSTTGVREGTVTGLDATVNYGNGDIVNGLIQTDVCAEPGDSGGALFAADAAVGLTSGGSGDCTSGGETFFQPVTTALAATGATIGASDASDTGASGTGASDTAVGDEPDMMDN